MTNGEGGIRTPGTTRVQRFSRPFQQNAKSLKRKKLSKADKAACTPACTRKAKTTSISPELQKLIDAWPSLPEPVKAGIVAMVKAATSTRRTGDLGSMDPLRDG